MSKIDSEAEAIYDKLGRGAATDVKTIRDALLSAEKRGREEERERACRILIGIADEIAKQALNKIEAQLGKSIASCAASIRSGS